jgi:hypothetical protein
LFVVAFRITLAVSREEYDADAEPDEHAHFGLKAVIPGDRYRRAVTVSDRGRYFAADF